MKIDKIQLNTPILGRLKGCGYNSRATFNGAVKVFGFTFEKKLPLNLVVSSLEPPWIRQQLKITQLSSTNLFLLVNTPNVSMISGINNNNFTPKKEPKRKFNPPLRYKISQFFQNIQPFLVATLCIGKSNF